MASIFTERQSRQALMQQSLQVHAWLEGKAVLLTDVIGSICALFGVNQKQEQNSAAYFFGLIFQSVIALAYSPTDKQKDLKLLKTVLKSLIASDIPIPIIIQSKMRVE